MLQSLQIWQNFYKCGRICSAFECCKYCRVLKIVQLLQTFFQEKRKKQEKCNVAEPTAMAELSKCCSASNVANISVPSNNEKCCRVLYKSRKFANVAEPTDVTDLSKYCSAFNGCNYCTDLKNVANVTKTLRKKKQHYCAFRILQSVAELKIKINV